MLLQKNEQVALFFTFDILQYYFHILEIKAQASFFTSMEQI